MDTKRYHSFEIDFAILLKLGFDMRKSYFYAKIKEECSIYDYPNVEELPEALSEEDIKEMYEAFRDFTAGNYLYETAHNLSNIECLSCEEVDLIGEMVKSRCKEMGLMSIEVLDEIIDNLFPKTNSTTYVDDFPF